MIQVTNDVADFLENNDGTLLIYGIGNPGRWVSTYMKKCGIEWDAYVDQVAKGMDDVYLFGKRIMHPQELPKYESEHLRIIIAVEKQNEVLADLQWYAKNNDILCLVAFYKDYLTGEKVYDINKMLSYFRCKLVTKDLPTIISNSCNAGFIYRALGMTALSPTVNVGIYPQDFIKICRDPYGYLSEDIIFDHWTCFFGRRVPVGKIKDIEINFAHSQNAEKSIRNWNTAKKWIDWDNLMFVMADDTDNIPYQILEEFCNIPQKHLCVLQNALYSNTYMNGIVHVSHGHFHMRNNVIENWFDILGWVNGEFEIGNVIGKEKL